MYSPKNTGVSHRLKANINPKEKESIKPNPQTIRITIRFTSLFDWMYKIVKAPKEANFPASMSLINKPINKGIPTQAPATIGRCQERSVLLNLNSNFHITTAKLLKSLGLKSI